ncbi:hypothetical protein SESBI_07048 [Sesbania bispinosa]|nr:hypothetical protein SESBI_07048 [Sesbania bispinosa]
MAFLTGCCKFLTIKKEWSKSIHQKPLSREEDSEEKRFGNWANLPANISELILRRLSRADFYRFGEVDLGNQPQLVEVQSLRDGILFLSHKGSKIVPSSSITGPEDLSKGNTIYFVQAYPYKENPPPGNKIVKFCMTDMEISHIHIPESKPGLNPTYLWFMPTLW